MTVIVDTPLPNVDGVKYEVALGINHMLKQGRRYFGSAGASLSHHVNNPDYDSEFRKKLVENGLEGERNTSKIVREWMENKPNAVLLDSVHIRGMGKEEIDKETGLIEGGDTDHVLVIGNQVILIDSKRWKSKRSYSVSDKGTILRQGKSFGGGRIHAKQAKYMWKKYLDRKAQVSSIVCINQQKVFVRMDANWKKQAFKLYTIEKLPENLDYRYERMSEEDRTHINSTLISQIAVCCIKPYDPYARIFDMNQINSFK